MQRFDINIIDDRDFQGTIRIQSTKSSNINTVLRSFSFENVITSHDLPYSKMSLVFIASINILKSPEVPMSEIHRRNSAGH